MTMNEQPDSGDDEARSSAACADEHQSPEPNVSEQSAPETGAPSTADDDGDGDGDDAAGDDANDDYADIFATRSFGGEFIWAEAPGYVAKILRIKADQNVVVSTQGRRDMVIMLTGGRAVLEIKRGSETEHVELVPAEPHTVRSEQAYRLLALSEAELFTIYTPL